MLMLGMIMTMVSQAGALAERIFEILDAESEVIERSDAVELPAIEGRGAHEDLLATRGVYQDLYVSQFRTPA